MSEIVKPGLLKTPKRRNAVRFIDVVVFMVVAAVIVVLAFTLANKLRLKSDVTAAQKISDRVVAAIRTRDGAAVYRQGTPLFQRSFTETQLTARLQSIESDTPGTPVLDRRIVYTDKRGRTVYFIYRYRTSGAAFYVRTGIYHKQDGWKLTDLSANTDESKLTRIN